MNETLKTIATKAQVEHCISHVRLEEFAELIVKECADIRSKLTAHYIQTHPEREQALLLAALEDYANLIKEHFGVK